MRIPDIVIFCGEIVRGATYSSSCLAKPQKIQSFRSATKIFGTASESLFHVSYTKGIPAIEELQKLIEILNCSNAGEVSVD